MTSQKHFKQLVRARMARTGEPFAKARDGIQAGQVDVSLADPVVVDVHGRHGQCVMFTPDGTRILSGGQDARVAILDAASGEVEGELTGHEKVVNGVGMGQDADSVLSVSSDRTVRLWDLPTRSASAVFEGHRDAVIALDVAPDRSTAITSGYDGRVRIWDLSERICVQEYASGLKRVAAIVYSADGALFAVSGQGPTVSVRQVEDGAVVAELETSAPGVVGLALAPDGAMLAGAGYDGTVTLWDTQHWEPVRELRAGGQVNAVCFSRSGRLVAAAAKGRIVIWSDEADDPVAVTDLPISGVYSLAFSPDARRLAQTGADGRVRIWTLRS